MKKFAEQMNGDTMEGLIRNLPRAEKEKFFSPRQLFLLDLNLLKLKLQENQCHVKTYGSHTFSNTLTYPPSHFSQS